MSYTCTVTIVTGYGVLYGEGAGNQVLCKKKYSICRCAFSIFHSDLIQRNTASHINPFRVEQGGVTYKPMCHKAFIELFKLNKT